MKFLYQVNSTFSGSQSLKYTFSFVRASTFGSNDICYIQNREPYVTFLVPME